MKEQTILEQLDPEWLASTQCKLTTGLVKKLGAAALTTGMLLASRAVGAEAKTLPGEVLRVLRFALLLERLESQFYSRAVKVNGLIPPQHRAVFEQIERHEGEHVALLSIATGAVINTDRFDFFAGGRYPDVFRNYQTFLKVSQSFEDTGVSAYKGQAPNLKPADPILSIALRIHSVEARHAAIVRRIRGVSPWDGGAFDEPLTRAQVAQRIRPFLVDTNVDLD